MGVRARALRRISSFRRTEDGSVTVEFVLWFPFCIFLLAILTDFVMIYMTNSSMWSSAREATRAMAVRSVDADGARNMIEDSLIRGGTYEIQIALDAHSSEVSTSIRFPLRDASVFGVLSPLMDEDLVAVVRMAKEPL